VQNTGGGGNGLARGESTFMGQNDFLRQQSQADGQINPGSVIGGNIGDANHHKHGAQSILSDNNSHLNKPFNLSAGGNGSLPGIF
jgi:hypothetical protein